MFSVTDGTNSAGYRYLTNSGNVSEVAFTNAGARRMITTRQFDGLRRLTNTVSSNATAVVVSAHGYQYNSANQRTRVNLADSSFWIYDYDALGQVKSGKRYWSDWTPVAGQQFEYAHDDIGNRSSTKSGGDSTGANLRSAGYTANTLNQITQRDVPGYVNIVGAASATATNVNVNNVMAYRRGEYYRVELSTNNGSAAVWLGVTNRVVQSGTTNSVTGNLFLPKTPEVFAHDADGNLTNDGHWAYVWDAENRLTRMVAPTAIPTGARYALNFTNDWRGRRTSKVVSNWTGSAWSKSYEHKFVYDGWNLVATLDAANTLLYSFQWGTDLSGSMQGAGGVGGLVSMTVHSGVNAGTYFYAFDGNGNVAALINAADGTIAARYEYGPFGELIRATGPLAFLNPFRFSTKFQDDETGFLYYGYRYYDPSAGRWPNRDPLGDEAFFTLYAQGKSRIERTQLRAESLKPLYAFVGNDPLNHVDLFGLHDDKCKCETKCKSGTWTGKLQMNAWSLVIGLHKFTGKLECAGQPDLTADVWGWNGEWGLGDQIGFKDVVVKGVYCCSAFEGYKDWWFTAGIGIFGWGDLDGLNLPGAMFVGVTYHGAKCSK